MKPSKHDLLDLTEVAKLLDMSPRTLWMYRSGIRAARWWATFPEPIREIGGSPVWWRADVEKWIETPSEGRS